MKIYVICAALFLLPSWAFARGDCDAPFDLMYYVEDDAIEKFTELQAVCDFTGKVSEAGLPVAHEMALWADGKFNLAHLGSAAGLNDVDANGNTVLHHAARRGHFETVLYLAWLGFDLNTRNSAGETPLHLMQQNPMIYHNGVATTYSVKQFVKADHSAFYTRGAKVPDDGCSTLCEVADDSWASVDDIMWAFLNGGNPSSFASNGYTALHYSAYFGNLNMARALVQAGADINIQSNDGFGSTPLHTAVEAGHVSMVQVLKDLGADPAALDAYNTTASMSVSAEFVRDAPSNLLDWLKSHRN